MSRRPRRASGKRAGRVETAARGRGAAAVAPTAPTRRTADATAPLSAPGRLAAWQPYACAVLSAAGVTLGLVHLLPEASLQFGAASPMVACVAGSLALGVAAGFWLPRFIIHRRLGRQGFVDHIVARQARADVGFAAALAGVLLLALGLLWAVLCGAVLFLEDYRALLCTGFVHPPWLTWLLLVTPLCLLLFLSGIAGTVALAVLHGWQRLVCGARTNVGRLWLFILAAAVTTTLLIPSPLKPAAAAHLAIVAVFGAAIVAVCRRPSAHAADVEEPARSAGPRTPRGVLLLAAAMAWLAGMGMVAATPGTVLADGEVDGGLFGVGMGVLHGIVAGRLLLRGLRGGPNLSPLCVLAGALLWWLPYWGGWLTTPRAGVVHAALLSGVAAICVTVLARYVVRIVRRPSLVLAWLGAAVAAGLAVGLLIGPMCLAVLGPAGTALLATLAATGIAGLGLIFARDVPSPVRLAGLTAVAGWLLFLLFASRTPAPARAIPGESAHTAHTRAWLTQPRTAAYIASPADSSGWPWDIDLGGPRYELIVLPAEYVVPGGAPADAAVRRLIQRCTRALVVGGRLVIELPNVALAGAALAETPDGGHYLRVPADGEVYTALLLGRDIPAWLAQLPEPAPGVPQWQPVRSLHDLDVAPTTP